MVAYRSDKAYWIDERLAEVGPAAQVFIEETHLEESKRRGKGGRPLQANQYSHRRSLSEWNGVERLGTLDADTGVRTRMTRGFSV